MYKFVVIAIVAIVSVSAEPKPGILAAAPLLAGGPAVVTATSSQSFVRNFAAPLAAAPAVAAPYFASPYVAAPYFASPYAAPLVAY